MSGQGSNGRNRLEGRWKNPFPEYIKRDGNDDSPKIIEETRQYIRDFDRVTATTTAARGLYDKMLELYPDRVNPGGALWLSARAVKSVI